MRLIDFDFDLPDNLIATRPVTPREAAKLLVVDGLGEYRDLTVADLPSLLHDGDILVFNDTKVLPARLSGKRGLANIEVTLHMFKGGAEWAVFAKPAKKCRVEDVIEFGDGFNAEVLGRGEGGEVLLAFNVAGSDLTQALEEHGVMPLPPYIARQRPVDEQDKQDYQTIFADREGAVAAPTAGLHWTPALLDQIKAKGVETANVTLHVGAGTFLPVKVDNIADHKMHAEWGEITAENAAKINAARAAGGRIIAVGTTSARLLESAATDDGQVAAFAGETDIFITPGYDFKAVDGLMTNFHLPQSTLLMLVSALCGFETMMDAYRHAVANNYRFYSYGDTSLLFPKKQ